MQEFCNVTIQQRYDTTVSVEVLDIIWATVVSIFLVGGVTGSLSSSWLADKLGRRGALAVGNICGIIGGILFALVQAMNSIEILMLGRLLVGNFVREFVTHKLSYVWDLAGSNRNVITLQDFLPVLLRAWYQCT